MTTWYTRAGRPDRLAYSVRPDIWPAGTRAWVVGRVGCGTSLANWGVLHGRGCPMEQYATPGAAEALVLGGMVAVGPSSEGLVWVAS